MPQIPADLPLFSLEIAPLTSLRDGGSSLMGGSGNDVLDGGRGSDLLEGGEGNDILITATVSKALGQRLSEYIVAEGDADVSEAVVS